MGAGSSGVDLNAIPSSALDRIEVLRDGAAAQYGSDAIAGVVNLVLKDGAFTPVPQRRRRPLHHRRLPGRRHHRQRERRLGHRARPRARWASSASTATASRPTAPGPIRSRIAGTGVADSDQRHRPGDPQEQPGAAAQSPLGRRARAGRARPSANFRMPVNQAGTTEIYAFGGYSHRNGVGQRVPALLRQRPQLAARSIRSASCPTIGGLVTDYSAAGGLRGVVSGWNYDLGAEFGHDDFDYEIGNTLNASLGPCLDVACAPGADGDLRQRGRSGHPEPAVVLRRAGAARGVPDRAERGQAGRARSARAGQPGVRRGVPAGALRDPARASWRRTSTAAPSTRTATDLAPGGSQSFPGFAPSDATDRHRTNFGLYADAETELCPSRCWRTWPRGSRTTATSAPGSAARLRSGSSRRGG